jgi:hypothetical protein
VYCAVHGLFFFLGLRRKVVTAEVSYAVSTHALEPVPLLQIFTPLCVRGLVRFRWVYLLGLVRLRLVRLAYRKCLLVSTKRGLV